MNEEESSMNEEETSERDTETSEDEESINKVIINLGGKEFASGLSYTAISRCRKIQNLNSKSP